MASAAGPAQSKKLPLRQLKPTFPSKNESVREPMRFGSGAAGRTDQTPTTGCSGGRDCERWMRRNNSRSRGYKAADKSRRDGRQVVDGPFVNARRLEMNDMTRGFSDNLIKASRMDKIQPGAGAGQAERSANAGYNPLAKDGRIWILHLLLARLFLPKTTRPMSGWCARRYAITTSIAICE